MKARVLPCDDFAEYGKTDRCVLVLTLSAEEAKELQRSLTGTSRTAVAMWGFLQGVSGSLPGTDFEELDFVRDAINTDGKTLSKPSDGQPDPEA